MTTLVRRLPWCHLLVVIDNKLTQPMASWLTFKLFGDCLHIYIYINLCTYMYSYIRIYIFLNLFGRKIIKFNLFFHDPNG